MIVRLPKAVTLALGALAFATFAPASVFAEPTPTEDAEEEKTEEKAEEKKICKRIAADAASRRRTKVCRTREEWKNFNRDQRRRN
ncbi:MAG: hypothetical protein AAF251_03035 [Pseudomonadota bacterium]